MSHRVTRLVLGPLLRHVGRTDATIWVETDGPGEVEVEAGATSARARTFHVAGHHYALVCLDDLEPGEVNPYTVAVDGEPAWPPRDYAFPAPLVRTLPEGDGHIRLVFGSCRVAVPHEPPFTWSAGEEKWGFERDALYAYALRMRDQPPERWPHVMFFCGDQIYADELSPRMLAEIDLRRTGGIPGPPDEAANFEEYTLLYRDAWSDPAARWFLSVVPSAMIFDDHDVHDDWNTSRAWIQDARKLPWWEAKMSAALASYWIYQHAGNLAPEKLAEDTMWRVVRDAGEEDLWPRFARFALEADRDRHGVRWSYCRDLAHSKLIVMDSRGGRELNPDDRRMVDAEEWDWIVSEAQGDLNHVLFGTSLPWLLSPAIHDIQRWDQAVAEGAWGHLAARHVGERLRRGFDLEHWPAFERSFLDLADLTRAVGAGERGRPPATVVVLSGDVHHAYLAEATWPEEAGVRSEVWQATCSPVRNPLSARERRGQNLLRRRPVRALARALARSAGAYEAPMTWREVAGPSFDNQIATLELEGRRATVRIERATGHPAELPRLECWVERRLDAEPCGAATRPPARARAAPR
jgi:PhoD-like phosphatase